MLISLWAFLVRYRVRKKVEILFVEQVASRTSNLINVYHRLKRLFLYAFQTFR